MHYWYLLLAPAALCLPIKAYSIDKVEPGIYNKLAIRGPVMKEPCIDVAINAKRLYTIGAGVLRIYDITDAKNPRALGNLSGLGSTRQLEIADNTAFIVSREDGLYIVDIKDPARPSIIYHYDTLEKATGLAVSLPLVAVASRFHGVELINVSDKQHLRYISTVIPMKEVQSVDIRNGCLYAGTWADRELIIVDIHNPYYPLVKSAAPLGGYGDGVRAMSGFAYAATGHHAPEFKKIHYASPDAEDRGYGKGHGLEIFNVNDPLKPQRLSRVDFPAFYNGYPDMWGVDISDKYVAVNDVYNGVFLIDISEKAHPVVKGRAVLPYIEEKKSADAAAAVAVGDGVLYVAGYFSGLYIVDAPEVKPIMSEGGTPVVLTASHKETIISDKEWEIYRPEGQVHAAVMTGGSVAAVAAGNGGIHIIDLNPVKVRHIIPTDDFVLDIAVADGMLYAAEATGGLSIWNIGADKKPVFAGLYRPEKCSVQQVVAEPGKHYVLIENGTYLFEIINVKNPAKPVCVLSDRGPGIFYGKCITSALVNGRYASVYWHMGGPVWYDLDGDTPCRISDMKQAAGNIITGTAVRGGELVVSHSSGYSLTTPDDKRPLKALPVFKLSGMEPINGKIAVKGNVLMTSVGAWKVVKAIDITDVAHPKLIGKMYTPGNPDIPVFQDNILMIPDGHGGLRMTSDSQFAPDRLPGLR